MIISTRSSGKNCINEKNDKEIHSAGGQMLAKDDKNYTFKGGKTSERLYKQFGLAKELPHT